jgi:hypothetical protein
MRRQYPGNPQTFLMTEFVAHGYISVRDAVDRASGAWLAVYSAFQSRLHLLT